ncbi:hypothetical protein LIER_33914 [Lithospermum erythrorhizon]|uniref:Uncharacterized protein n=1 Tax=Lithospermum erythrorhizon TaxID=34254 RepID=A0AAV3S3D3_LITER
MENYGEELNNGLGIGESPDILLILQTHVPSPTLPLGLPQLGKSLLNMDHEKLIFSLRFFTLQEATLEAYKSLTSSYAIAKGSSSHIPQLEWELKDMKNTMP